LDDLLATKSGEAMREHRRSVVAMVSDAIYPYHRGGKEVRYHELARRLAERAEVHVYTMQWWKGPRERTEDSVTFHAISRLHGLYTNNRRSISQAIFFAIACFRLLKSKFDVLEADHIPYFQVIVLRVVATLKRRRLVVTWHEVWGKSYWQQYLGRVGLAAWMIESLAMRLPDHIIAASPQTAERLRLFGAYRGSITEAPNGIDIDVIRGVYPDEAATDLVVVGRLMAHKRVDMLLEAVALLHSDGVPVTCRVIGDGPERLNLYAHARALGIDHAIDFRHDVREQKDVYALMKAAKVFVFPSAREGFGIAVLEALACGLPVVTTSAPDNLARHLAARSSSSVVCDPSATGVAAAVERMLAERGSGSGEGDGIDEAWLAGYSWDTAAGRVAEALII
jgi:glycosyltransferase involved in cell wall biosynthesis